MTDSIPNRAASVTPDDATDLANKGTLFIGGGGNLQVTLEGMEDGTSVTYLNLPDGTDFPRAVKRVWDASTTATNILVEWRN